jgi:hypothetical protein
MKSVLLPSIHQRAAVVNCAGKTAVFQVGRVGEAHGCTCPQAVNSHSVLESQPT